MYDHYYSKKRTIQFKNNRLTQRKNKKKLATRMAGLRLNIYTKCTFFSFFIHIYKIPATHTINTKNSVFCECLRAYRKCFRLLKSQNVKLNMKKKWLQRRKYFRKKNWNSYPHICIPTTWKKWKKLHFFECNARKKDIKMILKG